MRPKRLRRGFALLLLSGLAGLAALGIRGRPGRDERILRREFRQAARDLEKRGPENALDAARRADRIANRFVERPLLARPPGDPLPFLPLGNRAEIRSAVFQARALADTLSLRTEELSVVVAPEGGRATLAGTARVRVSAAGESGEEVLGFESEWVRTAEGWRVNAVRPRPGD